MLRRRNIVGEWELRGRLLLWLRAELLAVRRTSWRECQLEHAQRPLYVIREQPEHQAAILASLQG